jgi:hypothetical protein
LVLLASLAYSPDNITTIFFQRLSCSRRLLTLVTNSFTSSLDRAKSSGSVISLDVLSKTF